MNHSIKTGFSFGLTSGIITTLGLMVGLSSGTNSKSVVIAGILTIAIADSFSDALGIHISEESECKHTHYEIWQSTVSTFLSKFIFALTFLIPVLLLDLNYALIVSIIWGFSVLGILSYNMAISQKEKPSKVIFEHIMIAVLVVVSTYYAGILINYLFM